MPPPTASRPAAHPASPALRVVDREWFRQLVVLPPGLVGLLVPGGPLLKVLAFWDVVAVLYLVLSHRTYRTPDPAVLRSLVVPRRRTLVERLASSPRRQFASSAAVLALVATLVVIPVERQGPGPIAITLAVCVVAVLSSWVIVQCGFAVAYLTRFVERGGLAFPGDEAPLMSDFLYLAVAVGTSFSSPDVVVTDRGMRRLVLRHSLLAFAFNTVILASVVAVVSTFLVAAP